MILTLEALLTHQHHPSVELKRGQQPKNEGRSRRYSSWMHTCRRQASCTLSASLSISCFRVSTLLDTKLPTPRLKMHFFTSGNSVWTCYRCYEHHRRYVGDGDCVTHRAPTHLPAGIEGVRTHASISLLRKSARVFCLASYADWRSRSLKIYVGKTRRIGEAWVVSYFTDQLMTPCSKSFSGGSTVNGTPGGDRWARVLGGQIGWLS